MSKSGIGNMTQAIPDFQPRTMFCLAMFSDAEVEPDGIVNEMPDIRATL